MVPATAGEKRRVLHIVDGLQPGLMSYWLKSVKGAVCLFEPVIQSTCCMLDQLGLTSLAQSTVKGMSSLATDFVSIGNIFLLL